MTKDRIMTFVAQELPTFSIKRFHLQNVLNFNKTRPWPVKNSSVAQRLGNPPLKCFLKKLYESVFALCAYGVADWVKARSDSAVYWRKELLGNRVKYSVKVGGVERNMLLGGREYLTYVTRVQLYIDASRWTCRSLDRVTKILLFQIPLARQQMSKSHNRPFEIIVWTVVTNQTTVKCPNLEVVRIITMQTASGGRKSRNTKLVE